MAARTSRLIVRRRRFRGSGPGGGIRPGILRVYAALSTVLIAYVALTLLRPAGQHSTLVDGWAVDAFELVASGLCIASGLRRRSGRAVPLILGAGLATWALGDITLTIESLSGTPATPSVADAFYLTFFPCAYVALVLFIRGETKRLTTPEWLDGAVAGLGAAALCAAFAFRMLEHSVGEHGLGVAVNLAYPVGDVLLLLLVVGGSALLSGSQRLSWLLVAAGITINVLGDTSNLLQTSNLLGGTESAHLGTVVNQIAWPTSILLMSMAMWIPRGRRDVVLIAKPPGFVLPGLAAAVGLTILYLGTIGHVNQVASSLAAATLLLVVIRTGLSVHSLRALTRERQRLAVTDHLTGLGNRRHLFDVLDAFFAAGEEESRQLAFLFIDLDGFKQINDSFGHPAGDEILGRVGARLAASLRSSDLLTRVGGDEFAVVMMDAGAEQAAVAARRLSESLQKPFVIDAVSARIGASIGIGLAPLDAGDTARLMWCADVAMYRAKLGSSPFALYDHDFDSGDSRLEFAEQLHTAIHSDQLTLHYQPQLDLRGAEIITVEALVRWGHPDLGLIAPLKFLPLAEEAGLMGSLTRWVLGRALQQCAAWRAAGHPVRVSVNISAGDLLDPGLLDLVTEQLARYALPSDALVLEITETTLVDDFEHSRQVLAGLHDLGVEVSIDDFGAGFTSLAYLSALAVDELKLDRSFVTSLSAPDRGRKIELVRATIDLGHALRLRVVAEGIENSETLELLRELGCDMAQGYFIGKPAPADQFTFGHRRADARTLSSSTDADQQIARTLTSTTSLSVDQRLSELTRPRTVSQAHQALLAQLEERS
jgi:diguanylate cyclase (GGDEF)-like protein